MPIDGCARAAVPMSIMDAAKIVENTFFIIDELFFKLFSSNNGKYIKF